MAQKVRTRRPKPPRISSRAKRYATYQRWKRWLGHIREDITTLAVHRHIYREVTGMISANPRLQVPSSFYDWVRIAHVNDMTLGIRRLVDWDSRSISFIRLIEEIKDHPEVLTRRRYVALYRTGLKRLGHRDFDRFARPGRNEINPALIARDRQALVKAQERLRRFVNKHVAHRSRYPMRRLPTYADLDACVDPLEGLLKKYVLLLEAQGLTRVLPVWQYDWKAPFRIAWVSDTP